MKLTSSKVVEFNAFCIGCDVVASKMKESERQDVAIHVSMKKEDIRGLKALFGPHLLTHGGSIYIRYKDESIEGEVVEL